MTTGVFSGIFRKFAVWLALIIAACYAGSINGSFHFDDSHSIEANMALRSMANIPSFWTDSRTSSFIPENRVYRPLVYTFYSFCWAIGGGKTWPFHVMKMLMHWGVCLALFLIWRRLWSQPGWFPAKALKMKFPFVSVPFTITPEFAAFFLSALFAIHPAGSECVDYIAATTSLQCALFYVWAYVTYLFFRDSGDKRWLAASLALYFLSVASKEEGITLVAMVIVTEVFLRTDWKKDLWDGFWRQKAFPALKTALPFAAMFAALCAWIYVMHPESGNESRGYATSWEYFMTQWRAYMYYMRIWFWPWDFNADNASMEFSRSIKDPLAIQALIGNLFVLGAAWFNRKRYPALLFGVLWFYITISPASSVVVLAEAINEHRMYLAYIGFVGGTFTLLLHLAEALFAPETRARRLGWAYLAISAGLVIGTQERNRVWDNDENLWLDTVEKNPTSGRALNNLALVYLGRGEYEKAIVRLEKCEQHWTTYMYCPLNRGISYLALGQNAAKANKKDEADKNYALAEKALLRAYELNPRSVHVNFHLGKYSEEVTRDFVRAANFYQAAINLTGGRYPAAEVRLAYNLSKLGKHQEAQASFDRAQGLEPDNDGIAFERGRIELENGNSEAAARSYRKLIDRNPNHLQAWYNYGVAQMARKDLAEARKAFEKTVYLDPVSEQGWFNLAFVTEQLGDLKAALDSMRRLTKIRPERQEFQIRMQELEKRSGGPGGQVGKTSS